MAVQIGAKAHSFNDPTGLLSDCHRRMEMFLGSLVKVATLVDRSPSEETVRALQAALRYFSQAAPKHTADEEESLFPRLRGLQDPAVRSAFSALDRLEKDHETVSHLHIEVERLGARYIETGNLSRAETEAFRGAVGKLQDMYREHILLEDSTVFPLAARLLSDSEKSAIAQEMAGRRQATVIGIDDSR